MDAVGGAGAKAAQADLEARRAAGSALVLTAAGLAAGGGNVVFNIVAARVAGTDAYGAISVLIAAVAFVTFFATGLQYAVASRSALSPQRGTDIMRLSMRRSVPAFVLLVVVTLAAIAGRRYLNLPSVAALVVTGCLGIAALAFAVPAGVLLGQRRFALVAGAMVALVGFRLLLGASLPRLFEPTLGVMVASLLPVMVGTAALGLAVARMTGPPEEGWPAPPPGIVSEASVGAVCAGLLWAAWSVPVVFARHALDARSSGRFGAAQVLAGGILFATAPVIMAYYPSMVRQPRRRVVLTGMVGTASLCAVATIGLVLVGPWVASRLYGPAFAVGQGIFLNLAVSASAIALATYGFWTSRALRRGQAITVAGIGIAIGVSVALSATWQDSATRLALAPAAATAVAGVLVAVAARVL